MLSQRDLQQVKDIHSATMTDEMEVLRASKTSDGAGGREETYSIAGTYPCRLSPFGEPAEVILANKPQTRQRYRVTAAAGIDVRDTDRLVIDGETYVIIGIQESTALPADTVMICVRL